METDTTESGHRWWWVSGLVALVLSWPATGWAGAWAQEDRGLYAKVAVGYQLAHEQFKEDGDTFQLISEDENGSFRSASVSVYAEYGLLPRLTVFGGTSIRRSVVESPLVRITTKGIGDVRLGAKYQFLDDALVASAQLRFGLPTGYTASPENAKTAPLGNGVAKYEAALAVGKSFHPFRAYVSGRAGFRLRGARRSAGGDTVDYPPELPYALELAYGPTDWLWIRGLLRGLHGFGDAQSLTTFSLTPLSQSYLRGGPSLIFTVADRYQFNLDYAYTFAGVNTVRSHQFRVGVALDTVLAPGN